MSEYYLPHHVYCCRRGDDFVFLDLRQDDYTLVSGTAAVALNAVADVAKACALPTLELSSALRELVEDGLLTTSAASGRPLATTQARLPLEPLLDCEAEPAKVRLHHVWNFCAACVAAAVMLRWRHIENIVSAVARRKARQATAQSNDVARARDLTAAFHTLRSFFPVDYLCLYDSLALVEFLARYRSYPTWMFGVKLEPWAAHCWVQHDDLSYNEDVEAAAGYTPIMAI
jgi:hypothetical protein